MNSAELQFILRMRDEATAVLQQHTTALNSAGQGANKLSQNGGHAQASLRELGTAAKEATEALIGLWATNELAKGAIDAYQNAEHALLGLARQTDMTRAAVDDLSDSLSAMDQQSGLAGANVSRELAKMGANLGTSKAQILEFVKGIEQLGRDGSNVKAIADSFLRIQTITGQGDKGITQLADAIAALEKTSSTDQSTAQIAKMTEEMARATSQFKIGATQLAAYGAAAADLGLQPQQAAYAFNLTLTRINKEAALGSRTMQDLAVRTGMTADQWKQLIANDPSAAFQKVLGVVNAMRQAGNDSTPFLEGLGITGDQAAQVQRMAAGLDTLRSKMAAVNNSQGAAKQLAKDMSTTLDGAFNRLSDAWSDVRKEIGGDLAPLVTSVFNAVASGIEALANGFKALNGFSKTLGEIVSWSIVLIPAIAGIAAAWGTIVNVLGLALGMFLKLGPILNGIYVALRLVTFGISVISGALVELGATVITGVIGGLAAAFGSVAVITAGVVAGIIAAGVAIYAYWDEIKAFFSQSWEDMGQAIERAITDAFSNTIGALKQKWNEFISWIGGDDSKKSDATAGSQPANDNAILVVHGKPAAPALSSATKALIDQMDQYGALLNKITQQENALNELRQKNAQLTVKYGDDQIAQIQRAVALERLKLEPAKEMVRQAGLELQGVLAVTQKQKDQLDVQQKLRDLYKQNPIDADKQAAALQRVLEVTKQIAREKSQEDQLNPVGKAQRDYQEQLDLLNSRRSSLPAAAYQRELQNLNNQTLSARDPFAAEVRSMQDQIAQMKIVGDYREADQKTLQKIVDLQRQGVPVTKDMAAAMGEYNRAIQDAQKAQSSGFTGWINELGSLKDNILDLQKTMAQGLSDAIVDGLSGGKNAFQNFLSNIGKQILTIAVNQSLKNVLANIGLGNGGQSDLQRAQAAAQRAGAANASLQKNLAIQTAQIQANIVNLAGSIQSQIPGTPQVLGGSGNAVGLATDLIKQREGFRSQAYWDTNHWRVGYGSDTYMSNGAVRTTQEGTTTDMANATADLSRRIGDLQSTLSQRVNNWGSLNSGTQAAITDAAYNYGAYNPRLNGLYNAAGTGDTDKIVAAIRELKGDNGGVNASRRQAEIDLINNQQVANDYKEKMTSATTDVASDLKTKTSAANTGIKDMSDTIGGMAGPLASAIPGLSQFSGLIGSLFSKLFSGGGGTSLLGGIFGGMHGGGLVGSAGMYSTAHFVTGSWANAKRYHSGLMDDEYKAVLQRGERVLTSNDNNRTIKTMNGLANAASRSGPTVHVGDVNIQMQGSSGDPAQDRAHAQQVASQVKIAVNKAVAEALADHMRPGGMLSKAAS